SAPRRRREGRPRARPRPRREREERRSRAGQRRGRNERPAPADARRGRAGGVVVNPASARYLAALPPPGVGGGAVLTFRVVDVLADLPIVPEDLDGLAEARVLPPIAAALRAALDWLAGEGGSRRPLRVRADDASLEGVLERVDGRWIEAAGE